MTQQTLTIDERVALADLASLANTFARIVGNGWTRDADLAEVISHIHALQQTVMANAFARAHPKDYRMLGEARLGRS